jgi:hypothetical protein
VHPAPRLSQPVYGLRLLFTMGVLSIGSPADMEKR